MVFGIPISPSPQERESLLHNGVKGMKSPCGELGRRPKVFRGATAPAGQSRDFVLHDLVV